jgi:hypothetical protein
MLTVDWMKLPSQNTIVRIQNLLQSGTVPILDGKLLENMILTISADYLYLYHLNNNTDSYSV